MTYICFVTDIGFFMIENTGEILNVVYSVMGSKSNNHSASRFQISYDCPVCDDGRYKGNLEINYNKLVMKCWSCGSLPGGLKGPLRKIIKNYGSNRDLKLYDAATENHVYVKNSGFDINYIPNVKLPKEYIKMTGAKRDHRFLQAYDYLKRRGINDDLIQKYEIGFCDSGIYNGRIIIPSFTKAGKLNFFVARGYYGQKRKYDNPIVSKTEIIVNELNINWDSTIYIVEGMFDMIGLGLPNTIPLLGKELSPRLYYELITKAKGHVVICLDPDATQNAYRIYQKLDSSITLQNKVRVIDLPLNKDIAEINEEYGRKGVLKCLKKMRQLNLSEKIKYQLL